MSKPSTLPPEQQLCFALYATMHAVSRAYAPLLAEIGLTYPQYLVMQVLWGQDDIVLKAIGERLFLDSGTLTPLLKRLEAAGFVHRARNPADERQVRIRLTDRGRHLQRAAASLPAAMACAMGRPIEEIAALRDDLLKLRSHLAEGDTLAPASA